MILLGIFAFWLGICATVGYDHQRWSMRQRIEETCPSHCRCLKMPSTSLGISYARGTQYIAQSKIRVNSIDDQDYRTPDINREMICLGLRNIPSALPKGLAKLTIMGDSSGLRQDELDNHINADGGPNTWLLNTQLTELHSESFKDGSVLRELTISDNSMNVLYPNAFRVLHKLQSLKLQTNNIRHLSSSAFFGLFELQEVSLSDNLIGSLPSRVFIPLTNLRKLHLNGNKIKVVYRDLFRSLTKLEYLDMSRNNFSDLYDDTFDHNTALKELILNGNRLWSVKARWFQNLVFLEKLSIGGNSLTRLPPDGFVHLHNLRHLHLSANHIFHIDETTFRNLTSLQELDLSTNDLSYLPSISFQSLQNLTELSLRTNNMRVIKRATFNYLSSVINLDISHNLIREIEPHSFNKLGKLEKLDISYNKVRSIRRWTFSGLVHLNELNMDHNFISKLENYAFAAAAMSHLSTLTWLKLQYNRLKTITAYTFAGLPHLKMLNLGHNKISNINRRSFISMGSLRTVSINNNRLRKIENGFFINQGEVRDLNLACNRIKDIAPTVLVGLDHLEDLDLHSNSLSYIPNEMFRGSPGLIQVNLKQNKIKTFDFASVSSLMHLIYLDISENNMSWINVPGNLNMRLRHLLLASNALETLGRGIVRAIHPRGTLSLFNNTLACDCSMKWITEVLSSNRIRLEQSDKARCSSPNDFIGKMIEELSADDLRCEDGEINSTSSIICDTIPFIAKNGNNTRNSKEEAIARHVTFMATARKPILNGILLNSDWAVTSDHFLSGAFHNLSLSQFEVRVGHKQKSRVMAYVHNSLGQFRTNGQGIVLLRLHSKYPSGNDVRELPCFVSNIQFNTYSRSEGQVLLTARLDGSKPRSRLRSRRGEILRNCTNNNLLCVKIRDSEVMAKRTKIFTDGAPLFLSEGKKWHLVGMGVGEKSKNNKDVQYLPLWDAAKWIGYVIKEIDGNCMVQWMNGALQLKCQDANVPSDMGLLEEIH